MSKLLLPILLLLTSCGSTTKPEPKNFYNDFGGFDVMYIPIIKPYRATSTTKGDSWFIGAGQESKENIRLRRNTFGGIPTRSFGVSRNFIFGQTDQDDFRYSEKDVWFMLNVNTGVYSDYDTKEEMLEVLKIYKITEPTMYTCREYSEMLKTNKTCYWYPQTGTEYPTYTDESSATVVPISIKIDSKGGMNFTVPKSVKVDKTKVYHFKVELNTDKNDLYYVSVDDTSPVLAKNGLTFPVFIYEPTVTVAVYTPFPVAEEKGIAEENRVVVSKTMLVE